MFFSKRIIEKNLIKEKNERKEEEMKPGKIIIGSVYHID